MRRGGGEESYWSAEDMEARWSAVLVGEIAPGKVQKRPTSNIDGLWQQRGMGWPSGDEEGQERREGAGTRL